MRASELKASIKLAWWLRPYIHCLVATCWLTGKEPDMSKVQYWIRRGIRLRAGS